MSSLATKMTDLLPALSVVVSLSLGYYFILRPIYYLAFHPLRRYPGPKLWAMSRLPLTFSLAGGHYHEKLLELHATYGEIVRVAPTQISFVNPEAWKEIMGHRKAGMKENPKDAIENARNMENIIFTDSREKHGAYRRTLSHAFSAKAMMEQEPLIRKYVDLFFEKLREHARADKGPLDIVAWYNSTTFDIIGDLAFGEAFGSLQNSALHPWVALIFDNIRQGYFLNITRKYFFHIDHLVATLFPSSIKAVKQHEAFTRQKIDKRLAMKEPRPDFVQTMMRKDKNGATQTKEEITQNASILILAGSETTATVLSFATYLLCKHPEVMQKLRNEVDETFKDESEVNLTSVQSLKYMLAVLDETMRLYPAAASIPPRVAADGGTEVFGEYVPEKTELRISQVVINRWPGNFAMADKFIPERWMGDPRFANDRRDAFQPFSHGPRDCIGKNLAYAEMRSIFARMLLNFDMELDKRSENWTENLPVWVLWDKPPMWLHLKERRREVAIEQ